MEVISVPRYVYVQLYVAKRKERKRTGLFLLFPDDENRQLMRQKVRFDFLLLPPPRLLWALG